VVADGEKREWEIKGSDLPIDININVKCRKFSIGISSMGQADIVDAVLYVDVI
jgi:hypothetical protein